MRIFFFTAPYLLIKDAPSRTQSMNDSDSSLTCTNDLILTHIRLFGKASLDISANTLILNATMKNIISTNRFQESLFLVFCNFLLYFHLFNFFSVSLSFRIHSYSFSSYLGLFLFSLLTLFFYIIFLVIPRYLLNV